MTFETTTELKEWQQKAVDKLLPLRIGALYMDMGTGKTRTALEIISRRINAGKLDRVLWLCPCSIKQNIAADISKHCTDGWESHIAIAGIESLSSSITLIKDLLNYVSEGQTMLVVDESLLVKNHKTLRSQEVEHIAKKCNYRMILNGTPISKNEKDLYMQWKILDWRVLGYQSFWSFSANHLEYDDRGRIRKCLEVDTLTQKISPYTYQVKREECMELPAKHYAYYWFRLDDNVREHYMESMMAYLELLDDYEPATLYKLFSAMQTITSGNCITSKPMQRMVSMPIYLNPAENPRNKALFDIINDNIGSDKCIIFCKYQREINDIVALLRGNEYSAVEFTGKLSIKKRNDALKQFAESAQFFVANKSCAAFGLNLQFCHNEIFYNNDWDYATRIQAEDRVHRLGQEHEVNIYDIAADETIDEQILKCLSRKSNLLDSVQKNIKNKTDAKSVKEMLKDSLLGSKHEKIIS